MKTSSIEIFIPVKLTDRITVTKVIKTEENLGKDERYSNSPWRGVYVIFNDNIYIHGLGYCEKDDIQKFFIANRGNLLYKYSKDEKTAKKHVRELINQLENLYF